VHSKTYKLYFVVYQSLRSGFNISAVQPPYEEEHLPKLNLNFVGLSLFLILELVLIPNIFPKSTHESVKSAPLHRPSDEVHISESHHAQFIWLYIYDSRELDQCANF
jgi:hypothetical protein